MNPEGSGYTPGEIIEQEGIDKGRIKDKDIAEKMAIREDKEINPTLRHRVYRAILHANTFPESNTLLNGSYADQAAAEALNEEVYKRAKEADAPSPAASGLRAVYNQQDLEWEARAERAKNQDSESQQS